MLLSSTHRRFLLIELGVIPALVNLILNGLICWALFRSLDSVPLWGESSVSVDLLSTAFFLPLLTYAAVNATVLRQLKSGKISPLSREHTPQPGWFRKSSFVRGSFLGTAGIIFAAIPVVWALNLGQAQPFPVSSFVAFKAVWAGLLAMLVTPLSGWWALTSASSARMV